MANAVIGQSPGDPVASVIDLALIGTLANVAPRGGGCSRGDQREVIGRRHHESGGRTSIEEVQT
ncbi:MAG: hypothetical protein GWP75_02585 [Planctomycetia bacterium]|nr:hypothetical protein [Planctomycetia bacterium]